MRDRDQNKQTEEENLEATEVFQGEENLKKKKTHMHEYSQCHHNVNTEC